MVLCFVFVRVQFYEHEQGNRDDHGYSDKEKAVEDELRQDIENRQADQQGFVPRLDS